MRGLGHLKAAAMTLTRMIFDAVLGSGTTWGMGGTMRYDASVGGRERGVVVRGAIPAAVSM